jgi:hypothetical protein
MQDVQAEVMKLATLDALQLVLKLEGGMCR